MLSSGPFFIVLKFSFFGAVRGAVGGKREKYRKAFIQALLSTAVLLQRLSFFTLCLNKYLPELLQGGHQNKIF